MAKFEVKIIEPEKGPVEAKAKVSVTFAAVALLDGKDVSDAATFVWEFGDGEAGKGQKTDHAYAEDGEYNVSVTASYCDANDTYQATADLGGGASPLTATYTLKFRHTSAFTDPALNGDLYHIPYVYVESNMAGPGGPIKYQYAGDSTWYNVPLNNNGAWVYNTVSHMYELGGTAQTWTWNVSMHFQATIHPPPYPPGQQDIVLDAYRTANNMLVPGGDDVIAFDPNGTDQQKTPTISWTATHYDPPPPPITWPYWAHVSICDLASGSVIRTITKQTHVGNDSTTWDGKNGLGVLQAKGIYTYKVRVDHVQTGQDYCGQQDKVETPVLAIASVHDVHLDPDLVLTVSADWSVGGAVDACRVDLIGPKLDTKDSEAIGNLGQAQTGTQVLTCTIHPDDTGTYYVVIHAKQTAAAGEHNRERAPKWILHHGLTTSLSPKALVAKGHQFLDDRTEIAEDSVDTLAQLTHTQAGQQWLAPAYAGELQEVWAGPLYDHLGQGDHDVFAYCGHSDPNVLLLQPHDPNDPNHKHELWGYSTNPNSPTTDTYYLRNLPNGVLHRCMLAYFASCQSGASDAGGHTMLQGASDRGARAAFGFIEKVYDHQCHLFDDTVWTTLDRDAGNFRDAWTDADSAVYGAYGPLHLAGTNTGKLSAGGTDYGDDVKGGQAIVLRPGHFGAAW